ncbi:ATP-dependent DNA ligase [Niastella yeongjuensis]|uniref:DNA ligase (ATP) n=1 Tax=Niastella yeongjuensis TaxID=354355 RepID=A0A1V9EYR6_9BACT|nr:ATP-dependent DNA ligase [Niastella yeongjuensis]OQP51313.1 ATP-dependent DNA ligase [Niastella yeongjuensis]SEP38985.1 DNA ligase-1 [Niastella yeongjuensis]
MREFAQLIFSLGTSTKTNDKLQALSTYFSHADEKDKVWVIALFSGRRPRRTVSGTQLAAWCCELVDLPIWLFQECYHTVGDLSETIALLIPDKNNTDFSPPAEIGGKLRFSREEANSPSTGGGREEAHPLHYYVEQFQQLEKATEPEKKTFILQSWQELNSRERFVFNKLLSGTFRVGVSQKLMVNALARTVQLDPSVIAHRISGNWDPATTSFDQLLSEQSTQTDHSKPYPFYLAYALEGPLQDLGEPSDWQAEWKWDGIRGQIIKRNDQLFVWSRGEDLITDKFPEYSILQSKLENGTVLDGEILPYKEGQVLNFNVLQTRIGRKNITKKNLQEAPVGLFAYDLLELQGEDIRHWALAERRAALETLITSLQLPWLQLSPIVTFNNWEELTTTREQSRSLNSEGLMLKRRSSAYQVGRKRGDWWKWKIDPLTIDAVMVYAQKGTGRRSNLYTDYTFAVKDGDKLVPFTKAYSGLTDKEFAQVDSFVKKNSLEKFGPVRTVKPELVFEIAFEGIAASNRHKSGVALRFPRISRWRTDKLPNDINTLEDLKQMLELYGK